MQQDASLLIQHGWMPFISTPNFPERPNWFETLRNEKIRTVSLPYPYVFEDWKSRHLQKAKAHLLTCPKLRHHHFDMAHVFLCWTTYGLGILWAIARAKIPAMVSVHNAFPFTEFTAWHRSLLPDTFTTTQRIVAVSDSALQLFLDNFSKYLPASTVTEVIPNAVDTDRFKPKPELRQGARERLGLKHDDIVIGSIGRLDKQKQPWKLIETVSELHRQQTPAYLVLVGQGALEDSLREQIKKLNLDKHVIFTGFVGDVEDLLPAFDIHLLLSKREGFGLVTAEALAAGIPAIGSNVPGTRDILSRVDSRMLLRSDSAPEIARQLSNILTDMELQETTAMRAPAEIKSRFGKEYIEKKLFTNYQACLEEI